MLKVLLKIPSIVSNLCSQTAQVANSFGYIGKKSLVEVRSQFPLKKTTFLTSEQFSVESRNHSAPLHGTTLKPSGCGLRLLCIHEKQG